jgi:hypothetical protein
LAKNLHACEVKITIGHVTGRQHRILAGWGAASRDFYCFSKQGQEVILSLFTYGFISIIQHLTSRISLFGE